jgi:hypothetical protein
MLSWTKRASVRLHHVDLMKTFLSSTYVDLANHRKAAAEAVERLGHQVGHMEVFGARPEEPSDVCLSEIDECDLFVGIYAHRYGYVPDGSHLSITESEFDHARKNNKPAFCFLVDEDHPWPPKMIEKEPGRSKLSNFKAKIGSRLARDTFTTPDDLAYKVAAALGRYLSTLDNAGTVSPSATPALSTFQVQQITDVQNFFGGRDETRLRELFDLPNLLRFNILFNARDLKGRKDFPVELSKQIDTFFEGGQGIVSVRYANLTVTPAKTVNVQWLPGKVGVINTSKKYIESKQKLAEFLASAYLPEKIQDKIRDFDKALSDNIEFIMFDVLNEKMSNPAAFVFSEMQNSPFYGAINGEYWSRAIPLEPKLKALVQEMRTQLGTK